MAGFRSLALIPFGLSLIAPVAHAQEAATGFSQTFEMGLVSDYVFRGLSNSDSEFAAQPAYTANWAMKNGMTWSAGAWGSSLVDNSNPQFELDLWGSVAGSNSFADYSAAVTWYSYPGSTLNGDLSYGEVQLTASKSLGGFATLGGEYDYSPDFYNGSGQAHYANINLTSGENTLPVGLVLSGHVGKQWIADNAQFGTPDYSEGGLRLSRDFDWLSAGVEWTTTDLSSTECFSGLDICGDRVFATLTASFSP